MIFSSFLLTADEQVWAETTRESTQETTQENTHEAAEDITDNAAEVNANDNQEESTDKDVDADKTDQAGSKQAPKNTEEIKEDPAPLRGEQEIDLSTLEGVGEIICDNSENVYRITGSTEKQSVVIKGGTSESPVKVVLSNASFDFTAGSQNCHAIKVESGAHGQITLEGTNTIKVKSGYAGIYVHSSASAEIVTASASTTTIRGGEKAAAIGGADSKSGTIKITMKGGKLDTEGGKYGAAIGGGNDKAGPITITGSGEIIADGGLQACGIGAGRRSSVDSITVEGTSGTRGLSISAKAEEIIGEGGNEAAAIGSSIDACGGLTLKNAVLNVRADGSAATIGSGSYSRNVGGRVASIYIDNCEIKEQGGGGIPKDGAGIGAGYGGQLYDVEIRNSSYDGYSIGTAPYPNHYAQQYAKVGNIIIYNSDITADAAKMDKTYNRAGIGSGCWGTVESITIEKSKVKAVGSKGGAGIGTGGWYYSGSIFSNLVGGNCGDITIKESTVEARGAEGGAGIGGGFDTSVGDITIEDSVVTADANSGSNGGTGIGGGRLECANIITIDNSTVTATGGKYSAGIGCSGDTSMITSTWNTHVKGIFIKNNSNVTATGGDYGAGIGSGMGGRIYSGSSDDEGIYIENSTVNAQGGHHGAGIGSGAEGYGNRGGNLEKFKAYGTCKITATGGSGGAGIGGGFGGGAKNLTFNLKTTDDLKYYVRADGTDGGAGIGGGGTEDGLVFNQQGEEVSNISIYGGYIRAVGGLNSDGLGAGAGIGGGARQGNLNNLLVKGGFIEAIRGDGKGHENDACGIGHGGSGGLHGLSMRDDSDFKILGGTILCDKWTTQPSIVVDGGSLDKKLTGVKNSKGEKVYYTSFYMEPDEKREYLTILGVYIDDEKGIDYGDRDIFSDDNAKVGFYLPKTSKDAAQVDVYQPSKDAYWDYYGTAQEDGEGLLKMDTPLKFSHTDYYSALTFKVSIDDSEYAGKDVDYRIIKGENTVVKTVEEEQSAPGSYIELSIEDRGVFEVEAEVKGFEESLRYWSAKGVFHDQLKAKAATVRIVEDPTKVYDGEPIKEPAYETTGHFSAAQYYYKLDGLSEYGVLSEPPKDAGKYSVYVKVGGSDEYHSAQSEPVDFEIMKAPVHVSLTSIEKSTNGTFISAEVTGLYEADGNLRYKVYEKQPNGTYGQTPILVRDAGVSYYPRDDSYISQIQLDYQAGGEFKVTCEYLDDSTRNYAWDGVLAEAEFHNDKGFRKCTFIGETDHTYGDKDYKVGFQVYPMTTDLADTEVTVDISYDSMVSLNPTLFEPTAEISKPVYNSEKGYYECDVDLLNAGEVILDVVITGKTGHWNTTKHSYKLKHHQKSMAARTFAARDGVEITEAAFGTLDDITYGVEYEESALVNGDTVENFMGCDASYGAKPIPVDAGASSRPYTISFTHTPCEMEINGETRNAFFCRNYEVGETTGSLKVNPAALQIKAKDTKVSLNDPEPAYEYELLNVPKDYNTKTLFETEPTVVLDTSKTGGKSFDQLSVEEYKDALIPGGATIGEDTNFYIDGDRSYLPGDLIIDKIKTDVDISVLSKIYDGKPVEAEIDVTEGYDGKPTVAYYEITTEDGEERETLLSSAPADVGKYKAVLTVTETTNYKGVEKACKFRIFKAVPDIQVPTLENMVIEPDLKLSAQALPQGWEWKDPDKELSVGEVREVAIYTPEDERNYFTSRRTLKFEVLRANSELEVTAKDKVYDGKPAEITVETVDWFDGKGEIEYKYYAVSSDKSGAEERTKLSSVPVDAGKYVVVASHNETENFEANTAEASYEIGRAPTNPEVPRVPDIYMKKDLKLKAQTLPEGWEWKNPDKALSVGKVKELAVYTPEDARNYLESEGEIEFEVLRADSELKVTAKNKIYDGKPAEITVETVDWFDGKEEIKLEYFSVTADDSGKEERTKLGSAPVEAGKYVVVASHEQTENFEANTAEDSYEITRGKAANKTGDYTNITMVAMLMLTALAGVVITVVLSRRRVKGE